MLWHWIFDSIWGWIGTAGIVVIICVVVGYFVPGLRLIALEVAAVVLAAASIYTKGNRDEAKKWSDANKRDIQKGKQARTDAERDVESGSVHGTEWNRDERNM